MEDGEDKAVSNEEDQLMQDDDESKPRMQALPVPRRGGSCQCHPQNPEHLHIAPPLPGFRVYHPH